MLEGSSRKRSQLFDPGWLCMGGIVSPVRFAQRRFKGLFMRTMNRIIAPPAKLKDAFWPIERGRDC